MTKEQSGKKGQQATEINRRNYAAYIARLQATEEKFPCNQFGTVNIEGVAEQIGCTPKVLLSGSLKAQFQTDVESIGVRPKKSSDGKLAQKAQEKSRENSNLWKQLNLKIKEIESLRAEVERLSSRVRQLEARRVEDELSFSELLKSGRRFTL